LGQRSAAQPTLREEGVEPVGGGRAQPDRQPGEGFGQLEPAAVKADVAVLVDLRT